MITALDTNVLLDILIPNVAYADRVLALLDESLAQGALVMSETVFRAMPADLQKIFDGLSGVDQIALSVRDNQLVAMVTGSVTDSTLPAPEAGLKAVPVSANAMLVGRPDAVDQAVDPAGTVKQAVVAMDMEMNETGRHVQ